MLIRECISQDDYNLIRLKVKLNNENMIVLEKPSSDSDLFNLNKISN